MTISDRARDLIVAAEVTSEDVYKKKYRRPEWPGGASGVTVGIGYDLGMASKAKITADWQDRISPEMLKAMVSCAGISGSAAKQLCSKVRNQIDIPWDDAIEVFDTVDVPAWEKQVTRSIPNAAKLNEDCLGVLVSLAYNRGASFDKAGDRYREMRAIKADVQSGDLEDVAAQLRSMKRLWPDARGLRVRREDEAKLWEKGLADGSGLAVAPMRLSSGDDRSITEVTPQQRSDEAQVQASVTPIADKLVESGKATPDGIATVIQNASKPIMKSKSFWAQIATGIAAFFGIAQSADMTMAQKAWAFFTSPGFLLLVVVSGIGLTLYLRWKDHGKGALKS